MQCIVFDVFLFIGGVGDQLINWRWRCFNFSITCLAHTWILCVGMLSTSTYSMRCVFLNSMRVVFVRLKENARFLFLFWALLFLLDIFCHTSSIHHLLWRQRRCNLHYESRLSTMYALNLATHNVFARTLGHSIDSEKPCGMHFVVIYNVVNYSQVIATKQISFREFKRKTSELSGNHSGCNKTNAALSPTIDSIILFSRHKEHSDEYKWKLTNEIPCICRLSLSFAPHFLAYFTVYRMNRILLIDVLCSRSASFRKW